jgi:iron complex outermembrane receptor protein
MLNLSHTFNQNNSSAFETNTAKYTLLNLGFGGKIKVGSRIFELNLNGNNLLDQSYFSHLSRLKTDGIPNIGRNIILGVHFAI